MIGGLDEAGRGCLAGPVVAAYVEFSQGQWERADDSEWARIQDSKKLSPQKRAAVCEFICREASYVNWIFLSPQEIDRINILQASLKAFRLLVEERLEQSPRPELLFLDGNFKIPGIQTEQHCIVGGDGISKTVAAASVVAKVKRDQKMLEYHQEFPEYGFDSHKGYGTAQHWKALESIGPCEIHRRSFLKRLDKQKKGDQGETIAEEFLRSQGYSVLERNWRSSVGELDIVAYKGDDLRFIEVRSRNDENLEMAFPKRKQQQFQRTVESYLRGRPWLQKRQLHFDFFIAAQGKIDPIWDVFGLA